MEFLIVIIVGLAIFSLALYYNREELLKVIKDKENVIDANTRAVTELEGNNSRLLTVLEDHQKQLNGVTELLEKEQVRNDTVLSQKKSTEVRMGAISENALPLLQDLPYLGINLKHLGQPIDFLYFSYDDPQEIVFIEVKSGGAKESKRQKLIKNIIKNGKIHYDLVQITGEGVKITRKV